MKFNIAYLYYDLLNLYGDSGNIKAIEYHLKEQGIDVNIKYLSINDKKDFSKYDLIYIGSGTDKNILLALDDLLKYKKEIKSFIDSNKFIFVTGNAIELFGKYIRIKSQVHKSLNLFNYYIDYDDRIVKDAYYYCEFIDKNIIGFENHLGHLVSEEKNLFKNEGVYKKNFYGSYIIGPLLIRNPDFCKYFIKKLLDSKNIGYNNKKENYLIDEKAYNENIKSDN